MEWWKQSILRKEKSYNEAAAVYKLVVDIYANNDEAEEARNGRLGGSETNAAELAAAVAATIRATMPTPHPPRPSPHLPEA